MKTLIIISILCLGIASGIFAQKVDFSGYLASSGGVHTSTPSVVDKNGNIFVAGGTRGGLKVTNNAFQKSYKGHTDKDVTGGERLSHRISLLRKEPFKKSMIILHHLIVVTGT